MNTAFLVWREGRTWEDDRDYLDSVHLDADTAEERASVLRRVTVGVSRRAMSVHVQRVEIGDVIDRSVAPLDAVRHG